MYSYQKSVILAVYCILHYEFFHIRLLMAVSLICQFNKSLPPNNFANGLKKEIYICAIPFVDLFIS